MLGGIEGVTCSNVNQAIDIVRNPNATTGERLGSAHYISIVVNSHLVIVVGLSIIGVESVAGIISSINTVGIACAMNSACEGEAANIIGRTGEYGEQILENFGGESQVYFSTSQGGRFVDQLINGMAYESKVGYVTLTNDISLQVSKDVELLETGQVKSISWVFFNSLLTGMGGPSGLLYQLLYQNGISVLSGQ